MSYAPVYPHDPVTRIADDVYMVRGAINMNPLVRITRNMAIVRDGSELTVINPLRLDPAGESQLEALGTVRRVMRLGPFHGIDDPYYVDRFKAEFWCQPGGTTYPEPAIDVAIAAGSALPFANAQLFCFETTKQAECVVLLNRGKSLLLTCDAIQNYGDYSHNNFIARMMLPFIGFPKKCLIGPLWLKAMTREGESLKGEFERLLQWRFDALLSAHGTLLETGAHAAVTAAFGHTFPDS